jgi:four helix bundle protein
MSGIRSHRDLKIWQRSMALAQQVYIASNQFPDSEKFGLTSQVRRASVSVPSNIAEGYYRNSAKDYAHFLSIARGSLMEIETQLDLACRFSYFSMERFETLAQEIGEIDRMISALQSKLR